MTDSPTPQDRLSDFSLDAGAPTRSVNVHKRSKKIRFLRLLLPLGAALMIAMVFIWPEISEDDRIVPEQAMSVEKAEKTTNELIDAQFDGIDSQGRPFMVKASKATQTGEDDPRINLTEPFAVLTLDDQKGTHVRLASKTGLFDQNTKSLSLEKDVTLTYIENWQLETATMLINLDDYRASSDTKVKGIGPDLSLEAKGLRADHNQGTVTFIGPAVLTLYNGKEVLP